MDSVDESVCFVELPTQAGRLAAYNVLTPSVRLPGPALERFQLLRDFVDLRVQAL
jgi:hypothetical protein